MSHCICSLLEFPYQQKILDWGEMKNLFWFIMFPSYVNIPYMHTRSYMGNNVILPSENILNIIKYMRWDEISYYKITFSGKCWRWMLLQFNRKRQTDPKRESESGTRRSVKWSANNLQIFSFFWQIILVLSRSKF